MKRRQKSNELYIENTQQKDERVWRALLEVVQREIGNAQLRLSDLRQSESFLKGQIDRGEPLPEWAASAMNVAGGEAVGV